MIKYILISIIIIIFLGGFLVIRYMSAPLSKKEGDAMIQKRLERLISKNPPLTSTLLTIGSNTDKHIYAAGTATNGSPVAKNARFHSASVGKTFTTTLAYMLQDEGLINVKDRVSDYLSSDILEGIFVYEGVDYSEEVTIEQLIGHTSGAADYFEDPVTDGSSFKKTMLEDPDRYWNAKDLVAFTKNHQKAVGRPGDKFHYSDTGYILMGLVLESATGEHFHDLLHNKIFEPLAMKDSYLMFHAKSAQNADEVILPIYLDDMDLSTANVLSIDWSGGGIVTTTNDLLTFFRAFHDGELISKDAISAMTLFDSVYDKGIYYGQGLMQFRLSELSIFLRGMPDIYGGIGASGCYMFYDPSTETYYIFNLGSIGMVEKGMAELIQIMMIYDRIDR